jgi:Tfp pilus assembly PilM family ATPase
MARILGIDIDRSAVRAALLKTSFRGTEMERYLQIPLAEAPESAGYLIELHEALANVLRAVGKPPDTVISSLDGEQASLRVVELPAAASKRISEVLPFELESMLPFDIADAVIDHQPIDMTHGPTLRLLAAAALRSRIRDHVALFQGSAVDPRQIAVGAAALDGLRALCPALATGNVGVIELCDRQTNVCVLTQGRASFARTLSVGREALPKQAAELLQGVHRSISAYLAAGGAPLTDLHLCGDGPLAEMAPWLSRELGVPTQVLSLPSSTIAPTAELPVFARAAALAARASLPGKRINLRTGEFASKRGRSELLSQVNLVIGCIVAVLLCSVVSLKARQSLLLGEQAALRKHLEEKTQEVFGNAEGNPHKVETLLAAPGNDNPLPRFDAYDALAALSDAIPASISHEVRHVRIDLAEEKKEGSMELQGALASIEQRDEIVSHLEAHGCFTELQRGRTSPGRTNDQINYQLEAKLQCPGDAPAAKKHKRSSSDE